MYTDLEPFDQECIPTNILHPLITAIDLHKRTDGTALSDTQASLISYVINIHPRLTPGRGVQRQCHPLVGSGDGVLVVKGTTAYS